MSAGFSLPLIHWTLSSPSLIWSRSQWWRISMCLDLDPMASLLRSLIVASLSM
ncbi:unnamed protein product [Periconia digitata]|uniref:Uncharacterized protein n=1 Tax=Periconia digitata TaxID=1303443 RepID=A0A9W4XF01_9PLEO|nr:unnamed protein product [Periconia digitata]